MTESSRQQFQIYLPGLLKVLAENLYSNKKVAIRELIQNAHDSCIRRQVEGEAEKYAPRIDVTLNAAKRTITIRDNGSGLTADEVTDYLATIGRSYTRELGEKLAVFSPDESAQLIGQFGLGFLSAFLIASEVTLITRSIQPDSAALRWRSSGDVHYDVTPAEREEPGTTVELKIKPAASFILNPQVLAETIQQYADFLPIPIYFNNEALPVNLMAPPWEAADSTTALTEYIARVFKSEPPLCIIPLDDQTVDLGHDSMTIPLKGFLFVPPRSVVSVREYGDVMVYIRRMFICEHQRDLLPPWARFVRGVIDCPHLQPTASREDIRQEETSVFVQQALEEQLTAGLRRVAKDDPATWKKIVQGHADLITGWAVQDNEFFNQVADLVTFRTSRGPLSLPEYTQLTDGTVYYVTRELGSLQEQLLGEGHGVPVVDASWFAVTPFLQKYAEQHPNTHLVQMDGEAKQLLRPTPEAPFAAVMSYYRGRGVRAKVVTFKPDEVPALLIYPKDAEFLRDTRNALEAGELPGPLAGLVSDYMHKFTGAEADLAGTLYLNAACPLIVKLASTPSDASTNRDAALALIYQLARLFAGRMMTPADATAAFKETITAIEGLVEK